MVSLSTTAIVIAGLVIGLLLGLTGGGGSILTVPLLVYVVGLDAKIAIATSLLIVGLASLAALLAHSRAGNVYWRTGIVFGLAGMVGAYGGGRVAQYIADAVLLLLFAGVMIGSGSAMLRRGGARASAADGAGGAPRSWLKIVLDGLVVGVVTGLVGAGGGFLVVPALALLGGLPMHAAVGTSLLVIAMKCFAGLAGYIAHVPIDVNAALIVSVLAIAGTLIGTRISRLVSGAQLQRGFGAFVLLVAAILIVIEGSALAVQALGIDRYLAGAVLLGLEAVVGLVCHLRRVSGSAGAELPH
ncbi:MAG: sulfite exporter TauE/SafE family protein [Gammaproteobacteria bacterium]